jgi:hypothetical protein
MVVTEQIRTINFRVFYGNFLLKEGFLWTVQLAKQIYILLKDNNEAKPLQFNPQNHTLSFFFS